MTVKTRGWRGLAAALTTGAALVAVLLASTAPASAAPAGRATNAWQPDRIVTITLGSSGLHLDAYDYEGTDYRVVTRPPQNNNTQRWRLTYVGPGLYRIAQVATNRFLDAYDYPTGTDWQAVTRPFQNNDTQVWRLYDYGGNFFTIQQVSTGRFLESYISWDQDLRVTTRPWSGSNQQTFRIL